MKKEKYDRIVCDILCCNGYGCIDVFGDYYGHNCTVYISNSSLPMSLEKRLDVEEIDFLLHGIGHQCSPRLSWFLISSLFISLSFRFCLGGKLGLFGPLG